MITGEGEYGQENQQDQSTDNKRNGTAGDNNVIPTFGPMHGGYVLFVKPYGDALKITAGLELVKPRRRLFSS